MCGEVCMRANARLKVLPFFACYALPKQISFTLCRISIITSSVCSHKSPSAGLPPPNMPLDRTPRRECNERRPIGVTFHCKCDRISWAQCAIAHKRNKHTTPKQKTTNAPHPLKNKEHENRIHAHPQHHPFRASQRGIGDGARYRKMSGWNKIA